jgi:hypothetical protein
MKSLLACLAALILSGTLVRAQEPPLPSPTETPAPSPSATASVRPQVDIPDIPLTVEPAPLVPNTSATPKKNVPSITELDAAFQHSSLGAAVEEQRLHLEWRKLKNRASDDPEVVAARKAIRTARTELDKRDLTRAYYKIFYNHMQALAGTPEIKGYLEQKKKEAIASLAQPRVRPDSSARPKTPPND